MRPYVTFTAIFDIRERKFWVWLPVSHRVPLNPGAQLQLNPFTRSVQVPLFSQGWLAQSSTSVSRGRLKKIYRACLQEQN